MVTGSSRGFGRLICLRLAESGHSVYASMRNLTAADDELAQRCTLLELDVTDPAAVTRAVAEPWPLGDPQDEANAVVRAIEDETTPLRVMLGEDAAWYINARSHGDEAYRQEIWKLWHLAG